MSTSSIRPSNQAWLTRFVTGQPHQIIGGPEDPYLLRWYLIPRNPWFNVYLHKFLRSDDDRALHDHPWWFVSLILRGGYVEIGESADRKMTALIRTSLLDVRSRFWRRCLVYRQATYRHRVALPIVGGVEQSCWTLIVTGRRTRTWGFWCPIRTGWLGARTGERFIRWDEFGAAGCGEQ